MDQICKQTHEYFKRIIYLNNSDWIIKLNNPELADINPKDESQLSDNQKVAIITECKENPIYFFREILEYPMFRTNFKPFKLTKNTSAKIFLELYCNKGVLDLDPRQSLKTGTALMIILYKFLFSTNEDIKIITKDLNGGLVGLEIIEKTIHHLPKYLLPKTGIKRSKKYFENTYNSSRISLFPVLLKEFEEGPDQGKKISDYFDNIFREFSATYIMIDNMIYKWFYHLYKALYAKVYNKKCIIDVIQYLYDKSGFVKDNWYFGTAWDEAFYDKLPSYTSISDLILLHYEPEELYDLPSIYHLSKCLLVEEDSDDKKFDQFRNELCIRPYDNDFNIRDYYKELKVKCESK